MSMWHTKSDLLTYMFKASASVNLKYTAINRQEIFQEY